MTQIKTIKININGVSASISDLTTLILKNETYIISTCPVTGAVEIDTI